MAAASSRKMEKSERRLVDPLGHDLYNRVPSSNRLFNLPDARWLRLRLSMGVSLRIIHARGNKFMGSSHDDSWPIVASATVIGSTCSFIVSRTLLSNFVNRLVANDKRYEALSLVLKHDGLKLLVMIRLCPLPYSISNGAISTFPTVQPLMFAAATAAATPKLLIAIWIGSRLALIARSGEKMDRTTKAINWASIIFGGILGVLTGWIIYKRLVFKMLSKGFI